MRLALPQVGGGSDLASHHHTSGLDYWNRLSGDGRTRRCRVYVWGAIRFNIARLAATDSSRSRTEEQLDREASWALAFAYIVSVAYYLNLLGAFSVSLTASNEPNLSKIVATGVFVLILAVGVYRGFAALERLEQISVGVKLSIIGGLLFGLGWFFVGRAAEGNLVLNPVNVAGWEGIALVAGLIVAVQGFETSRYLGDEYDAETRLKSMRLAQWISTLIYMLYIVAPILPVLLIAAAISAQFSAAVADTGGSGGLFTELMGRRMSATAGYVGLVAIGISLTWTAGVFDIISYASRAFAAYYAI